MARSASTLSISNWYLDLSLGGSRTARSIRAISGDSTIRVSALMIVGRGGILRNSSIRSIVSGSRSLRVGGKRAGRNDRVILTLSGYGAGRGGRIVLRDIVGVGRFGEVDIAIRGLRMRNGPIDVGSGGRRWGRDRRVMAVVIRSRTIRVRLIGSVELGNSSVVSTLDGGSAGRGGRVVLVLGNTIGVDWVGGLNIAIRGLRGRNGPLGVGSGGGRWGRDGRVMTIMMKNGTTGVSPVRSIGSVHRTVGSSFVRSVVMRDSHLVTSVSWDTTTRISRARPIVVVLSWNRCRWCGWVVGGNRPGVGRIDLVRFRGRRDGCVGFIAGRGDRVRGIRTSFRDRDVTWVVSVLARDRDGGVGATVGWN